MLIQILTALGVILFASIVTFVGRLRFLDREPWHSQWLSFAGGVAIAYCFDYLLPKLAKMQPLLAASTDGGILGFLEHHIYLVATAGLVVYMGLARASDYRATVPSEKRRIKVGGPVLKYADVLGATAYFLLLGYLLSELKFLSALLLYVIGMGLHVLGLAHVFRERYPDPYDPRIRWFFAGALFVGGAIGATTEIAPVQLALFTAFLAGGIIPTALRDELPERSRFRFWPFLAGVCLFLTLTLVVEFIEKNP